MGRAGIHAGAAAHAALGVYIELSQSQAGTRRAFLAPDMGHHFRLKAFQRGEDRQGCFFAQGAVAGNGHGLADFFGQIHIGGLGPAVGCVLHQGAQLIQALPAEGALAAALLAQGQQLGLRFMDRAAGFVQAMDHAAAAGHVCHRQPCQLGGRIQAVTCQNPLALPHQLGHQTGSRFLGGDAIVHRHQHTRLAAQQAVGHRGQLIQAEQLVLLVKHLVHQGGPGHGEGQVHHAGICQQFLGVQLFPHHQFRTGCTGQNGGDFQARHQAGGVGMKKNVLHPVGVGVVKGTHHLAVYRRHRAEHAFQLRFSNLPQAVQSLGIVLQQAHCAPSFSS